MAEGKQQQGKERAQERGDSGIPKFRDAVADRPRKVSPDNLSEQFDRAKHQEHVGLPDVLRAFSRAAGIEGDPASTDDSGRDIEKKEQSTPDAGPRVNNSPDKGRGL